MFSFITGVLLYALGTAVPADAAAPLLQFPADIGWTDITKAPYNCVPDGEHDCTRAINTAIRADGGADWANRRLIYFPAGTYLVSDRLEWKNGDGDWYGYIEFQGQGEGHTVIKLQDDCPGYDVKKAVIFTADQVKDTVGNEAYDIFIRDMTIHTGTGNPGAVAVDFLGHNGGGLRNVSLTSGDGTGYAGLRLERRWPGPAFFKDVTITGYDYAITAAHLFYSVTFEDITIRNQNKAGILNDGNVLTFHRLTSENAVPALKSTGELGHIVLINGNFSGGDASNFAIENAGEMYLRAVSSDGYRDVAADIPGDTVVEFVQGTPLSLFDRPETTSLHLEIKETPDYRNNDTTQWASARMGLQNALHSGKPVVYLPFDYVIEIDTFDVPATVRKIVGFKHKGMGPAYDARVKHGNSIALRISEDAPYPVIIEHLYLMSVLNGSNRELVLRNVTDVDFVSQNGNTNNVFLEDYCCQPLRINNGQKLWARQLNIEGGAPYVYNDGGTAWILGYKTEWPNVLIHNVNGAQTEWLGGLNYPVGDGDTDHPLIINDESEVSAIYSEYGLTETAVFPVHVQETHNGETRSLLRESLVTRGWGKQLALYVGHNGSKAVSAIGTAEPAGNPAEVPPDGLTVLSDGNGIAVSLFNHHSGPVRLALYDTQGRIISTLHTGTLDQGLRNFRIASSVLPGTGTYLLTVKDAGVQRTVKILFIR